MRTILIEPDFDAWREAARHLLGEQIHPRDVLWSDGGAEPGLFASEAPIAPANLKTPRVSAAFLDLARLVAAHSAPERWGALYGLLWRLTWGGEPHLLSLTTDPAVRHAQGLAKAVRRDIHKMHAFVRFRLVGTDAATGREQFVAWFEPAHRTLRMGVPFFRSRFASMDWSILTPYECAHWDGHDLHFTAGVSAASAPAGDALDALWRTYFRSIFNPARLKVKAMQSEMPKKYWKNLPEAGIIGELIEKSSDRTQAMLNTPERPVRPAPKNAYLEKLHQLNNPPTPDA